MAKKSNKLTKKAKKFIKTDMFTSLALASMLLNLFFLTGIAVYNGTNQFDDDMYSIAKNRFCVDNLEENIEDAIEDRSDKPRAAAEYLVECRQGAFEKYHYDNVSRFFRDQGI